MKQKQTYTRTRWKLQGSIRPKRGCPCIKGTQILICIIILIQTSLKPFKSLLPRDWQPDYRVYSCHLPLYILDTKFILISRLPLSFTTLEPTTSYVGHNLDNRMIRTTGRKHHDEDSKRSPPLITKLYGKQLGQENDKKNRGHQQDEDRTRTPHDITRRPATFPLITKS